MTTARPLSRSRALRLASLATLGTLLAVLPLARSASAEPLACKRAISSGLTKFVQGKVKLLKKCNESVLKGKISGPCPDAATATRITALAGKLRRSVSQRCGGLDRNCGLGGDDDTLASIGWNVGTCPNLENGSCNNAIADCNDVVDCLYCVGEAAVDQAMDVSYGSLTPSGPGTDLNRCQTSIGKTLTKYFQLKAQALAKCEDKVLAGVVTGPCPDPNTASKLARAGGKVASAICRACGGPDRSCDGSGDLSAATIGFPANCPAVTVPGGSACGQAITTLQRLADCVGCLVNFKTGCLDALGVLSLKSYPGVCSVTPAPTPTPGAPTTTPTSTRTRTPTPVPTATPTGGAATATPTPTATTTAGAGATATATTTPTTTPSPRASPRRRRRRPRGRRRRPRPLADADAHADRDAELRRRHHHAARDVRAGHPVRPHQHLRPLHDLPVS